METLLLTLGPSREPDRRQRRVMAADASRAEPLGNLAARFVDVALGRSDRPAIVTPAATYSYGWLLQAAVKVCHGLRRRPQHAPGERVALQLSNSPEYMAAFYGALLADCIVVPMPSTVEEGRRQKLHYLVNPSVLITRPDDRDSGDQSTAATLQLANDAPDELPIPLRQAGDLAMLLCTSGSTGSPKAVMLSHGSLLANADAIRDALSIIADDRALAVLPFCHAFGNSILQTHVLAGATLLLEGALTFPASIVQSLRDLRATSLSAVPETFGMLMRFAALGKQPLPHLRYMSVAGGELRPDLAVALAHAIAPARFFVMYGQSEATARLSVLDPSQIESRPGSIGKPIRNVELTVFDDANREVPPGTVGMLCARGPSIMQGYWGDPDATHSVLSQDGWLRTGDRARRDDDGYFYLHGRANLLVKVLGHRVHPAEIEEVVAASFPGTYPVAVPAQFGRQTRFVLFVAPLGERPIDLSEIQEACRQQLPPHKLPVHFQALDQFPLTSGHKVDRCALARLVPHMEASQLAPAPSPPPGLKGSAFSSGRDIDENPVRTESRAPAKPSALKQAVASGSLRASDPDDS